ncbi:oxidoreductase, partial [Salmonella enterica subsp. enterica serovar Eastbourne]|nr:oxidoreductase [Salmonella enterica subsp. enterica serovar Eastbourne]EHC5911042.1 oxidoreductase [Salmonella enterica subsp. enterica serovar Eastbourne]
MKKPTFLSHSDKTYLLKEAEKTLNPARRRLLRQGLTLGGIMLLTGCDISDNEDVEKVLSRMSR